MATKTTQPTTTTPTELAPKPKLNAAERFTERVLREFGGNYGGDLRVTDFQRSLIQGYFIGIDAALQSYETKRLEKKQDKPPFVWENVNLGDLARDVVHYARLGLDMRQKNHLHAVPYFNSRTGKYDINLMEGYSGIEYVAKQYAQHIPSAVRVELVYSTDRFRPIKTAGQGDNYEFDIINPFDRGEIVGGFGFISYPDPIKNKLVIMSRADIMKRKARAQSSAFWGQNENDSSGWFKEMCLKTLIREVYSERNMPRDPQKVDETYQHLLAREAHFAALEAHFAALEAQAEIDANANTTLINGEGYVIDEPTQPYETPQTDPDTGEISDGETDDTPLEGQQSFAPNF